ncbi:MAG: hypothetical protein ABSB35_00200 [Bryobacteraceae bacterium]
MPVIAQALQLVQIVRHPFAGMAVECIYMRNVLDLTDRCVQPAAIQTISVEVLANVGQVTLDGFVMATIPHGPHVMMLDVAQILLGSFDDTMGATPVALLRVHWKTSGEKQAGDGKR